MSKEKKDSVLICWSVDSLGYLEDGLCNYRNSIMELAETLALDKGEVCVTRHYVWLADEMLTGQMIFGQE